MAVTIAGCDGGPKGGEIDFTFDGPQAVAALQFQVTAVEPETIDTVVAACAGCTAYMVRDGERDVRGVLVGDVSLGPTLAVTVSNIDLPESYEARVTGLALSDYSTMPATGFTLRGPQPSQ
jgi:hypothetical protein